ncbi:MAG: hypothetical protein V4597_18455 [Pseudomonadota bacterium]
MSIRFAVAAGDGDWAAKVRNFNRSRDAYLAALQSPPPAEAPLPINPDVVELAAWRHNQATRKGPLVVAFEAYRAASLRLLDAWAPNSEQLRGQMRLAAELSGMADPAHRERPEHGRDEDAPCTPSALLAVVYEASLGLWQAEQRARRAAK